MVCFDKDATESAHVDVGLRKKQKKKLKRRYLRQVFRLKFTKPGYMIPQKI